MSLLACMKPTTEKGHGLTNWTYCVACHGANGEGKIELAAPPIAGLPAWYVENQLKKFRAGIRGSHPDDIPGLRMRPMSLALTDESDIKTVAAHVSKLQRQHPEPTIRGNAAAGKNLYATCVACHGADARGNQQLNAPPLTGQADWYLATQLHNFKHGIRGSNPRDTVGATMTPMAVGLKDQAAINDVVAYITELSLKPAR
jgi:cytochrome c553